MNKIYAYLFDDVGSLEEGFAEQNLHRLPAFRREQCAKYRRQADKNACIIAYLLLQRGLCERFGIMQPPRFIYNEYGKPYLCDIPQIFFNLSHCKLGVVCALADFEIGVDIQEIRPFDMNIAQRVCSDDELRRLSEFDSPSKLFCKLWTEKESYAKAHGISIANVLGVDEFPNGFLYRNNAAYHISIYCRESNMRTAEIVWSDCEAAPR